ncbi:MAG: transglycosylase SLT domain-containing protein [Rikenellaceae bacterium]|nr:transglycosylase SLT domain-containing protein [Rikenellaceae bacterium]
MAELLNSKGTTKDYDTEYEKREPLSKTPILKDQVLVSDNRKIEEVPMEVAVKDLTQNGDLEITEVEGEDGKNRNMVNLKIDLAPDNINTRAEQFLPLICKYAEKYNLDPALVCAIIHTESSFNPKAKSIANAHGLMQIVPTSAGIDAYGHIYKKEWTPTAQYLLDPEKNIELGTVYLHMLMTYPGYFTKVVEENSRRLCAIAAYNTGAGNVSRAFTGSTKLSEAIPVINRHTYHSLFNYMSINLPYEETRKYINNVTERMASYRLWINL